MRCFFEKEIEFTNLNCFHDFILRPIDVVFPDILTVQCTLSRLHPINIFYVVS